MPKTVWQLRGTTDKLVECCLEHTISKSHAVTVVLGRETFLSETYPDEASAMTRAMQVREGLIRGGGWTPVATEA